MRFALIGAALGLAVALTGATPGAAESISLMQTFRNPLNPSADPTIVYHDGNYYLATTRGERIGVWRSPSLATLLAASERVVWRDADPGRNQQMWAPAFRHVDARWYLYYTASDGIDANHRMYVLESAGDDPLGPYTFKARIADFGEYAIDGEPIVHNGQSYFVWSGPGRGQGGPAQLYIARMSNPWSVTGGAGRDPRQRRLHRGAGGPDPAVPQRPHLPDLLDL